MSAPLTAYLFDPVTPESRRYRDIENHYHLCSIAESNSQIAQFQAASLRLQAREAMETNQSLTSLACGIDHMSRVAERISEGLESLRAAQSTTTDAIYDLASAFDHWFSVMSDQMMGLQKTLETIADTLRRPLETAVLEMRRHADVALRSGMRATGKQREEWYRDAASLLQHAVENPVGRQDYVAWFQIGWLLWKAQGKLAEAESALDRAARLASVPRDAYYRASLRHLAYVRYLQDDYPGAHEAIREAISLDPDSRTFFDGARYAARLGHEGEAVALLKRCVTRDPIMIVSALAEHDFREMSPAVEELVRSLTLNARARAETRFAKWATAISAAERHAEAAACELALPDELSASSVQEARESLSSAPFLVAVQMRRAAFAAGQRVLITARQRLDQEVQTRNQREADAKDATDRARREAFDRGYKAEHRRDDAVSAAREERASLLKRNPGETGGSNLTIGCVSMVVALLVYASLYRGPMSHFSRVFLLVIVFGGWLLVPLLHWVLYGIAVVAATVWEHRVSAAAATECVRATAEADQRLRQALPALESAAEEARSDRGRAEAAIAGLAVAQKELYPPPQTPKK